MATVYFTNTADSGDGSLRSVIASAVAGDIIMPDPDVFTSAFTITLSSYLIKNDGTGDGYITVDGNNLLTLNGGSDYDASVGISSITTDGQSLFNLTNSSSSNPTTMIIKNLKGVAGHRPVKNSYYNKCTFENCEFKGFLTDQPNSFNYATLTYTNCSFDDFQYTNSYWAIISGSVNPLTFNSCTFYKAYKNSTTYAGWARSGTAKMCVFNDCDFTNSPYNLTSYTPTFKGVNKYATLISQSNLNFEDNGVLSVSDTVSGITNYSAYGEGVVSLPVSFGDYEFKSRDANVKRCDYGGNVTALIPHIDLANSKVTIEAVFDEDKDIIFQRKTGSRWVTYEYARKIVFPYVADSAIEVRTFDGDKWTTLNLTGVVRKFTNTNDSGDGSLRAAIAACSAGDIVMPDPDVFTGDTVTVTLTSSLSSSVSNIFIDGGSKYLILDGGNGYDPEVGVSSTTAVGPTLITASNKTVTFNKVYFQASTCAYLISGTSVVTFNDCTFRGFCANYALTASGSSNVNFIKCTFKDCRAGTNGWCRLFATGGSSLAYLGFKNSVIDQYYSGSLSTNLALFELGTCVWTFNNCTFNHTYTQLRNTTFKGVNKITGFVPLSSASTFTFEDGASLAIQAVLSPANIANYTTSGSGYIALPSSCDSYDFADGSSDSVVRWHSDAGVSAFSNTTTAFTVTMTDTSKTFVCERLAAGVWTKVDVASTFTGVSTGNGVYCYRVLSEDGWLYASYHNSYNRIFVGSDSSSTYGSLRRSVANIANNGTIIVDQEACGVKRLNITLDSELDINKPITISADETITRVLIRGKVKLSDGVKLNRVKIVNDDADCLEVTSASASLNKCGIHNGNATLMGSSANSRLCNCDLDITGTSTSDVISDSTIELNTDNTISSCSLVDCDISCNDDVEMTGNALSGTVDLTAEEDSNVEITTTTNDGTFNVTIKDNSEVALTGSAIGKLTHTGTGSVEFIGRENYIPEGDISGAIVLNDGSSVAFATITTPSSFASVSVTGTGYLALPSSCNAITPTLASTIRRIEIGAGITDVAQSYDTSTNVASINLTVTDATKNYLVEEYVSDAWTRLSNTDSFTRTLTSEGDVCQFQFWDGVQWRYAQDVHNPSGTIYFTNTFDSGYGSLRQAIANSVAGDTVKPSPNIFGDVETITIYANSSIIVNTAITIDGGDYTVKYDGTNVTYSSTSQGFTITASAFINKFYMLNWGGWHGAIFINAGNLTTHFTNCTFESCTGGQNACCISNWGQKYNTVYVDNCTFLTGMSFYTTGCVGSRHAIAFNKWYISNCDFGTNRVYAGGESNWNAIDEYGFYLDNVTCNSLVVAPETHIVGKVECSSLQIMTAAAEQRNTLQFEGGSVAVKQYVASNWGATSNAPLRTQYLTVLGSGYIALPSDCDDYDFADGSSANVKRCNYGAGITALTSTQDTDAHTATATIAATDATLDFILEHKVAGVWTRLTTATTYTEEMSPNEVMAIRTWDGDTWRETYQYYQSGTTRYFYTNADSGDGSLRATITAASTGDVIEPSPDVFASGITITIPLSSQVSLTNASLTIQGNGRRIRLDGQSSINCLVAASGSYTLNDMELVRGTASFYGAGLRVNADANVTLNRCLIAGCVRNGNYPVGASASLLSSTSVLTANDSILDRGNNGSYLYGEVGAVANFNRCTLYSYTSGNATINRTDCIVIPVGSESNIGLVSPPVSGAWTTSAWENYDFRLLSTSSYKTGATTTGTDFYGRTRLAGGCLGAVANIRRLTTTAGTIDVWANDSPYIDSDDVVIGTLNLAAPLSVDKSFKVGTLYLTSTLNFPSSACDRYVSVTTEASFTGATATGYGYLAVPHGTTVTGLTAGANVVVCDYGAGVESVMAVVQDDSVDVFLSKSDNTAQVVVEKGENSQWTLLDDDCSTSVYSDDDGELNDVYRIFDGESFKTATAGYLIHGFVTNTSLATAITVTNTSLATAITVTEKYLLMSDSKRLGETPICFARIINSETETPLTQSTISSITYTIYKYNYASIRSSGSSKTAISGWTNLTVDKTTAIKDTPVSDDPRCAFAYNFIFEPITLSNSPFSSSGNYSIEFTVTPTTGNKVPIIFEFALV